jgi:hypothetical protein
MDDGRSMREVNDDSTTPYFTLMGEEGESL